MVRSCASLLGGMAAWATPDILVVVPLEGAALLVDGVAALGVPLPGVVGAGAVCAGRLPCGRFVGGFRPKNLAHSQITPSVKSEAPTIRSSCGNLNFFAGLLRHAARSG